MSIISPSDITIIGLILSVIAIVVVISSLWFLSKKLRVMKILGNSLDASALVSEFSSRQNQLERRMIDQKIRLEILELRFARQGIIRPFGSGSNLKEDSLEDSLMTKRVGREDVVQDGFQDRVFESKLAKKSDSHTINEMLKAVMDSGGKVTAHQIQQKIGRSREHTARMMNSLYKQGLISRNTISRPFIYSLTKTGENELREQG